MAYKIFNADHDEVLTSGQLIDMASRGVAHPEKLGIAEEFPGMDEFRKVIDENFSVDFDGVFPECKPTTLLLDASGSLRGQPAAAIIGAVTAIGDAMHAAGRPFEVLGFTTKSWNGGEPGKIFKSIEKRIDRPGRISDVRHMIFKGMDQSWPETRDSLLVLFCHGVLKENINGEAILWAKSRMDARGGDEHLILVGDGTSCCDMTNSRNGDRYLPDHYHEVVEEARGQGVEMSSVLLDWYGSSTKDQPEFDRTICIDVKNKENLHGEIAEAIFEVISPAEPALEEAPSPA